MVAISVGGGKGEDKGGGDGVVSLGGGVGVAADGRVEAIILGITAVDVVITDVGLAASCWLVFDAVGGDSDLVTSDSGLGGDWFSGFGFSTFDSSGFDTIVGV